MSTSETAILYVEDDPMSRQVMQLLLQHMLGYAHVTIFESSENFLERVHALSPIPQVIFLDIQIEPHTGYEMLAMLRSDPIYKTAKIIALTASVMATDVDQLKQAGFDGLIAKPIRKRVFPDLLQKILAGESVWFVA